MKDNKNQIDVEMSRDDNIRVTRRDKQINKVTTRQDSHIS
jgi:hypothetical protein